MALTQQDIFDALQIKLTPYIPHVPHETQHAFLWLDCFEALFGGAAGGGKSDALLMAALQYVDIPGYSAILFRKTYADLKLAGALIPRSHEWLRNTDARWNDNDKVWTFPSGATLAFGYMQTDEDRYRYQGAEFQFVGFDELTQFSKLQYTYLVSRMRKPSGLTDDAPLAKVPLRLRGASNPGGRGHLWVKRRFITKEDDPPEDSTQRIFIPSKLSDNPSVDQASYRKSLEELDDATYAQLALGDWDTRDPGAWVIPDPTWIDAAEALGKELWDLGPPPPEGGTCNFGIDWGEHSQGYIIWPLPDGGVFIPPSETLGEHDDPADFGLRLLERAERLRVSVGVANYDAAGVQSMRTFLATARKRPRWERLKSVKIAFGKYKRETMNYERLLFKRTALGKTTRVIAIHPDNVKLLEQLRSWKLKVDSKEQIHDETDKIDDHGPDAVLAGIAVIAAKHRAYIERLRNAAKGVESNE